MNIVIPLAGKDPNFQNSYKPFANINGEPLIKVIMSQHQIKKTDKIIFIILQEHENRYNITLRLRKVFGKKIIVRIINKVTQGAPCSILEGAKEFINNNTDLLIELADVLRDLTNFYLDIKSKKSDVAGIIPVEDNLTVIDRPWGYIYMNNNYVARLEEKQIATTTSPLATMGLYYFSQGKDFVSAAETMVKTKKYLINNMFYIGPIYNELIKNHKKIIISKNKIIKLLGSPEDICKY